MNSLRMEIILTFMLFIGINSAFSENCTFEITTNLLSYTPKSLKPIPEINVKILEIRNGNLPLITRNTFRQYKNLEKLIVVNSSVARIDHAAFKELASLKEIDLSNNLLKTFTFDDLNMTNLKKLVVSGNMLTNLNGCPFNKLSELDVSNNNLTYLPKSLRKRRSLQLLTENNPWECANLSFYKSYQKKFCINRKLLHEKLPVALMQSDEALDCSFQDCLYYIVGAAWLGIILGNLCKIRTFVCPELHETVDVAVQYEKMEAPTE